MDKLKRRKELRVKREHEGRHTRFIAEYVKIKHHDVYMEADRYYKTIRGKNPNKKDARKTDDFTKLTTQYNTRRAYYMRHYRGKNARNRQQYNDNLVLNIELMQVETPPETQVETQPETQVETQPETQVETQPETQVETQPETQVETQPETQVETQPETQQLFLHDHLFEGLMDEIRNDPDLYQIFNDFDNTCNECRQPPEGEGSNDDMGEVFNVYGGPTPLEHELTRLGF